MLLGALFLIIAGAPCIVNRLAFAQTKAPAIVAKDPSQSKAKSLSFSELVLKLLVEGDDRDDFNDRRAELMGFAMGLPSKADGVPSRQTADGISRQCNLVMEKPTGTSITKPICLVLMAGQRFPGERKREAYYFRVGLDGKLEKSLLNVGKLDESGNTVPGSGELTELNVDAAHVKAMLRRELDFWLKGKLRKKVPPAETAAASSGR